MVIYFKDLALKRNESGCLDYEGANYWKEMVLQLLPQTDAISISVSNDFGFSGFCPSSGKGVLFLDYRKSERPPSECPANSNLVTVIRGNLDRVSSNSGITIVDGDVNEITNNSGFLLVTGRPSQHFASPGSNPRPVLCGEGNLVVFGDEVDCSDFEAACNEDPTNSIIGIKNEYRNLEGVNELLNLAYKKVEKNENPRPVINSIVELVR